MLQDLWSSCILDQIWCLVLLTTLPCESGQELGELLLILSFPAVQVKGHRITEDPGLEGTHQDHRVPTPGPAQALQQSHPVPESIVPTLRELGQPWGCAHSRGEPVPGECV